MIILILTRVVRPIALEPGVAGAVLARAHPRLNSGGSGGVAVDRVLTSARRSGLRPSELLTTELTIVAVFCVDCNLLVPLLILQSLPYK